MLLITTTSGIAVTSIPVISINR